MRLKTLIEAKARAESGEEKAIWERVLIEDAPLIGDLDALAQLIDAMRRQSGHATSVLAAVMVAEAGLRLAHIQLRSIHHHFGRTIDATTSKDSVRQVLDTVELAGDLAADMEEFRAKHTKSLVAAVLANCPEPLREILFAIMDGGTTAFDDQ